MASLAAPVPSRSSWPLWSTKMGKRVPYVPNLPYYRAHIREAIDEDTIVCLECGGLYEALPNHLRLTHELTVEEYKARWGYNRSTGLYCRALARKFQARAKAMGFDQYGTPERAKRASDAQQGGYALRTEARLRQAESKVAGRWHHPWQKLSDEEVIRLSLQGLGTSEIAQRTGIHPRRMRARFERLRARGIVLPRPQPRWRPTNRKVTDEAILAGMAQGYTLKAIAIQTGVSRKAITLRVTRLRAKGLLGPGREGRRMD